MKSIAVRLLAFNLLLVFLPVAGLFYLDTYEKQLLEAQERSMVQQGRVLSAALAGSEPLDRSAVENVLKRLNRRLDARLRVVDRDGAVLGDTSRLGPKEKDLGEAAPPAARPRNLLYRAGAFLHEVFRIVAPPEAEPPAQEAETGRLEGKDINAALAGRYGTAMRRTAGQRSVTLSSAIPIENGGRVVGAVVVSQSTYRLLRDLYAVRLRILEICLASLAVAIVLSLLVSRTIARPLARLRNEAEAILDGSGRLKGTFRGLARSDEIGDLARALKELTGRLQEHVRSLESLASEVAHELKNPLASIRSAAEMLSEVREPNERARFLTIVLEEVARMEHQLSELAEIARIGARLEAEEQLPIALNGLLAQIVERFRMRENGRVRFSVEQPSEIVTARASAARLTQAFENVVDNAASFSPDGGTVTVSLSRDPDGAALVGVSDEGPGIPPAHATQIFERFFSYRHDGEGSDDRRHTGLGLAIVKAIVEGYGGSVSAENNPVKGATFFVRLPASRTGVFQKK